MVSKEWMTIKEAAEYLGISYGRMTTKVKEGVYPVSKVPGFDNLMRVSRSRIDQMMMEREEIKVMDVAKNGDGK